ncbi:MAG TPA: hypothetical protein VNC50_05650 [Planctomycetia bacterium]|nr:hypothetical protein [Planctomycetia bacterium]
MDRRDALLASAALAATALPAQAVPEQSPKNKADNSSGADRKRVIAAGMTEAEADCWAAIADAAGKFFALPELHPMDRGEVASAIHIVQNKLLSRPTYRKYLEIAKKGE